MVTPDTAGNEETVATGGAGAEQVSVGLEKDRIGGAADGYDIRWWFYIWIPGDKLRNQEARLGVTDNGFTFARGGRTATAEEARILLGLAQEEAEREMLYWRGQPSHALGPNGELVPLDKLAPEIEA